MRIPDSAGILILKMKAFQPSKMNKQSLAACLFFSAPSMGGKWR
jgi:hypothetical protein